MKWIEDLDVQHIPATINCDIQGQPYLKLKNHYYISIYVIMYPPGN